MKSLVVTRRPRENNCRRNRDKRSKTKEKSERKVLWEEKAEYVED
jgi:hypothetical protein